MQDLRSEGTADTAMGVPAHPTEVVVERRRGLALFPFTLPVATWPASSWLRQHRALLWSIHSLWALAWGVAFIWLGARHFAWLRVAFLYISFIWVTSLVAPLISGAPQLSGRQRAVARGLVNYFNKSFYQQLLFFVLPIYAASVTWGSANMIFVAIVAASAVLSTLDLVYDDHLSVNPTLTAIFFGFNVFVCVNVALPVLWSIGHQTAIRTSAALALVGFATLRFRWRHLASPRRVASLLATVAIVATAVEWARPIVPPAPLRLLSATFGVGIDRAQPAVTGALATLPLGFDGRVYGITAISAPLGLKDRVRHRWASGDRELYRSPYYTITGGRNEGFRLWTSALVAASPGDPQPLDLWVETEGGQIIGRARLAAPAARTPGTPKP
jgi:hypothetical protein